MPLFVKAFNVRDELLLLRRTKMSFLREWMRVAKRTSALKVTQQHQKHQNLHVLVLKVGPGALMNTNLFGLTLC